MEGAERRPTLILPKSKKYLPAGCLIHLTVASESGSTLKDDLCQNTDQNDSTRPGSNLEWETNVVDRREGTFTMNSLETVESTRQGPRLT